MKRAVPCVMVPVLASPIESQAARILTHYAESKGLLLGNKYAFCEGAREPGREQLNNMIEFLRRHREVRFVITNKNDRISRNLRVVLSIVEEFAENQGAQIAADKQR